MKKFVFVALIVAATTLLYYEHDTWDAKGAWVVIGDSQAEGHPFSHSRLHNGSDSGQYGQISFHLELLTGQRFLNRGIGGETSERTLKRFKKHTSGAAGLVVITGINDVAMGVNGDVVVSNILKIVEQANGRPCVVLNLPPARSLTPERLNTVKLINEALYQKLPQSVCWVDYYSWFESNPTLIYDNVHPTRDGYKSLSEMIVKCKIFKP